MTSPPRISREALVTMIPMMAVMAIVKGEARSCEGVGACLVLAYRVQSDWPKVPAPHAPRIEVMPNINAQPTLGVVEGIWNRLPAPPACETLLEVW